MANTTDPIEKDGKIFHSIIQTDSTNPVYTLGTKTLQIGDVVVTEVYDKRANEVVKDCSISVTTERVIIRFVGGLSERTHEFWNNTPPPYYFTDPNHY